MSNKITKKSYRFNEKTNTKIKQLKEYLNEENKNVGLSLYSENSLIEEAINYYHSVKIGKDVVESSMERVSDVIVNKMELIMRTYVEELAKGINYIGGKTMRVEELLLMYLVGTGFPTDPEKIINVIEKSKYMSQRIDKALETE